MTLMPTNSTALERAIDTTESVRIGGIEVPLRHLWDPDKCPASHLPWLAWAVSVDEWNPAWSDTQKRQVIKRSPDVHLRKGTRGAVESALTALGFAVTVIEWWEKEPKGAPGTFDLGIQVPPGYAVDAATYDEVERLTERAKNKRSHLGAIVLTPAGLTQLPVFSSAVASGIVTTLYPLGRIGSGDDVWR